MIKPMVFGFCSIGGRCHSGWWEWELGKLAQFQYLNFGFPVMGLPLSEFPIGGYVCGFSIRGTPTWILWVANFRFPLYEICVQNQWRHESLEILLEDSDTGAPSSIAVRIESLFTIFVPISTCELCLKNDEGEAESIIKWGGWEGSSLHGK